MKAHHFILGAVCAFMSLAASALDACTEGQQPWRATHVPELTAAQPSGVCSAFVGHYINGGTWTAYTYDGTQCMLSGHPSVSYNGAWLVEQVCTPGNTPEEPTDPGQIRIDAIDGHLVLTLAVGTQTIEVKPEPVDAERIADMGQLFLLILAAAVVVYCMRELANLFRVNPSND